MSEEDLRARARNNADVSRAAYAALEDASGSPSGLEFWPEMETKEKYWYGALALRFLERLAGEGYIDLKVSLGLDGEADYEALRAELERRAPEELERFEARVAAINRAFNGDRDEH